MPLDLSQYKLKPQRKGVKELAPYLLAYTGGNETKAREAVKALFEVIWRLAEGAQAEVHVPGFGTFYWIGPIDTGVVDLRSPRRRKATR